MNILSIFVPNPNFILQGILCPLMICAFVSFIIIKASKYYSNKKIWIKDGKLSDVERGFLLSAFGTYLAWGLFQQVLVIWTWMGLNYLGVYVHVFKTFSIVISAMIFSLLIHYPNIMLMLATLGMELLNLTLFSMYGNIYTLGFLHGFLATVLFYYYPGEMTKDFKVLWSFPDFNKK